MRGPYVKTDVSVKIALIQEYMKISAESGMKMSEFAAMKDISYSSFRKWIQRYRDNVETKEVPNLPVAAPDNGFIIISDEVINPVTVPATITETRAGVTLKYKGAVLEFENSQIEQVMEILRRW